VTFSEHALRRMQCRHISQSDVLDALRVGHVNSQKSRPNDRPCPTVAVESRRRRDGAPLRIVVATCDEEDRVVTCIALHREYACDCASAPLKQI